MSLLTIFTPTFNRGYKLKDVYDSLLIQTNQDFEWLVIDDGSNDDTACLVKKFIDEKKIKITYKYQENMGKHVAHNTAIDICTTEMFFCLDSDDILAKNCVEWVHNIFEKIDIKDYSGIVGLKGDLTGNVIGNFFDLDSNESNLYDLYNVHGKKGDTSLIFRTEVLKKHKFPHFPKEKFCPEGTIYNSIDLEYKLIVLNKILCLVEYLDDGLTRNGEKIALSSPRGYAEYKKMELKLSKTNKTKFKNKAGYFMYLGLAKNYNEILKDFNKVQIIIFAPIAIMIYLRLKYRSYRKD
ncbi:MAG: glycosyltransferase family 2 protein [Sarcina sp.]